jgi:hypothetical protein
MPRAEAEQAEQRTQGENVGGGGFPEIRYAARAQGDVDEKTEAGDTDDVANDAANDSPKDCPDEPHSLGQFL